MATIKVTVKTKWRASAETDATFNTTTVAQYTDYTHISAPSPPSSGKIRLFADGSDNKLKVRKADGTIVDLESGGGGAPHNLLDGSTHPDTATTTVARGMLIVGQLIGTVIKWAGLALGAAGKVLKSNGTDVVWDNVDWTEITNKPSTFPPSTHGREAHNYALIPNSAPATPNEGDIWYDAAVGQKRLRYRDDTATRTVNDWNDLFNKPTSFPPSAHAATHQHGGSDEIATATPAANAIPKANAAGKLDSGWITDNLRTISVGITIGDGINPITTGMKGAIWIPVSGTITEWTVLSTDGATPTTGSIEFDILKSTYANYPTMTSIVGTGTKPNISNSNKGNGVPTGWTTTTINAGDCLRFDVTSVQNLKRVTLVLKVVRV